MSESKDVKYSVEASTGAAAVLGLVGLGALALIAYSNLRRAKASPTATSGAPITDPLSHLVAGGDPALSWRSGGMMPANPSMIDTGFGRGREPAGVLG